MPIMELMFNPRIHNIQVSNDDSITSYDIIENFSRKTENDIDDIINCIENPEHNKMKIIEDHCEIFYDINFANKIIYLQNDRGSVMEFTILDGSDIPINQEAKLNILWYKKLPNDGSIWCIEWSYET